MKKISAKTAVTYGCYVALVLVARNVLDGNVGFGIMVGATYCANPIVCAIVYVAVQAMFGLESLLFACARVCAVLACIVLHKVSKRKISKLWLCVSCALANVLYCVYNYQTYFVLCDRIISSTFAVAFGLVCVYVFRAVFVRTLVYKPALDETVCIAIFAVVTCFCLRGIEYAGMNLLGFVAPYAICFAVCATSPTVGLVTSVLIGCGSVLCTGTLEGFVFCALCAVTVMCLNKLNRYVACLTVIAVDVTMSYFFDLHGEFAINAFIPSAVSVLAFVLTPSKLINYVKDCNCYDGDKYVGKSLVNRQRLSISRKLYRLADIFNTIKSTFFAMATGSVEPEQAEKLLAKQACDNICTSCENRTKCWRNELASTQQAFNRLAECAVKRGKCTILDVSANLSVKCVKLNALIAEVNTLAVTYKNYAKRVEQADNGKLLVGEQMGGVGGILANIANDFRGKIAFDTEHEKEITERLVFHNVLATNTVLMEQGNGIGVVVTVAKKDSDDHELIAKVVTSVVKQTMCVERVEQCESDSWVNVFLCVQPRFKITFGIKGVAKNGSEISGDVHSFVPIDNGKYVFSLMDGMGSGAKAEKASATAITLVENFYRAGFDSDVILSCVNKLLVGSGNNVFCAVDIVAVDLYNGLCDVIKLGSSEGFIKHNDVVDVVTGNSLPLGVLDEMKPTIVKKAVDSGDMIVLCSDGFTDCFNDVDAVCELVNNLPFTNAQSMADTLVDKAMASCNKRPPDDVTVIVAKIC